MSKAVEIVVLGRLLETGVARTSARSDALIRRYETARWIDQSGRKNEWKVRVDAIDLLGQRLHALCSDWQADFAFLRSIARNPYDPNDIEAIPYLRRTVSASGHINRRNWNATKGLGPKHDAKLPATATLTVDWMLRFRPNKGLLASFDGNEIRFDELAAMLTECAMPERLWLRLEKFSGVLPQLVVTCENLGAYIDLPIPETAVAIFAPGADVDPAAQMVKRFPDARWIHFGDVDQDGLDIGGKLAAIAERPLNFFVPSFADDYLPGSPIKTPWVITPDRQLFHELRRTKRRIFQEAFMLDARLADEVVANSFAVD